MAENEKLKILYVMQILLQETDRHHILNASQICEVLESRHGISCNRKTIYRDVERLQEFGLKIEQVKGKTHGYYIEERDFEVPELKLLVDAVQSSRFITSRKSEELIGKLQKLTSRDNARQLQRQVFIYNRPKTSNETIYASVDFIHEAIQTNRQISFKYCEWTPKKELRQRKGGAVYVISPWSLTWDDENYYLVAYDEKADAIKHYRVDKMQEMQVLSDSRKGKERFDGFDLAAFSKKMFGMYGGRDESVTLLCDNYLAGVIIDRFGKDTFMIPAGPDQFRAHVLVSVSPQFFGWVTGIGKGMKLVGPEQVQQEYQKYLGNILERYREP